MNQQHLRLGSFTATLRVYTEASDYSVQADYYPASQLVQLSIDMPIIGPTLLGFVDIKADPPMTIIAPKYHIHGDAAAEARILAHTVGLLAQHKSCTPAKEAHCAG